MPPSKAQSPRLAHALPQLLGAGEQVFTAGPLCMEFSARMYEQSWAFIEQGLPVDLESRRASLSQLLCLKPSKYLYAQKDETTPIQSSRPGQPVTASRVGQLLTCRPSCICNAGLQRVSPKAHAAWRYFHYWHRCTLIRLRHA